MDSDSVIEPILIKKKKGRPRKNDPSQTTTVAVVPGEEIEKKKRGRKKKEKIDGEEECKIKKKRGRKAALKFFSSSVRKKIPLIHSTQEQEVSILHLDLVDHTIEDQAVAEYNQVRPVNSSEMGFFKCSAEQDQKPNSLCNEETHHSDSFQILSDFAKNWPSTTDISCWWCCHSFTGVPIGLPISKGKTKYRVRGVFCSFPCLVAYDEDTKVVGRKYSKHLINALYKNLTGIQIVGDHLLNYKKYLEESFLQIEASDDQKEKYAEKLSELVQGSLEPAPPRCTLKKFGGVLTIEEFRNSTQAGKAYK
jgi:hypothetical protein